ncbi:MAG TPA: DUF2911 domain-containing protein [Flammeovirgaceae bacterium]|nr:DUF2911 domain-containing protein [Flammeovirgaceae bacterium]
MKQKHRTLLLVFFVAIILFIITVVILRINTKRYSPADVASISADGLEITINYCRPYKKGRLIFGPQEEGALQPFGQYWRLGANEATTLQINRDVLLAGKRLQKGLYSIYAVPGPDTWLIGVNSEAKRWGYAEPDYEKDVLRVTVPVTYGEPLTEQFTIGLQPTDKGALMLLDWDLAHVSVPIERVE